MKEVSKNTYYMHLKLSPPGQLETSQRVANEPTRPSRWSSALRLVETSILRKREREPDPVDGQASQCGQSQMAKRLRTGEDDSPPPDDMWVENLNSAEFLTGAQAPQPTPYGNPSDSHSIASPTNGGTSGLVEAQPVAHTQTASLQVTPMGQTLYDGDCDAEQQPSHNVSTMESTSRNPPASDDTINMPDYGSLSALLQPPADLQDAEPQEAAATTNVEVFDDTGAPVDPRIAELKTALQFIEELRAASLKNSKLESAAIQRLLEPTANPHSQRMDPLVRFSIDLYLATENASVQTYEDIRKAHRRCYPDGGELLSYNAVKNHIADTTGIYPIREDMCPNSCIAFTGPFKELDKCPLCSTPRYDQAKFAASGGKEKVGRAFYTMPIGPQLQALYRSPENAQNMQYRAEYTKAMEEVLERAQGVEDYGDIFDGSDYLAAVENGHISEDSILLMLSVDGAQLYEKEICPSWRHHSRTK